MIGDSEKHILSAKSAKIDAYLLKTAYNSNVPNSYYINNLSDLI
jgi:phosphoglycolate phosphatase-like HAD superfamily hydrolase